MAGPLIAPGPPGQVSPWRSWVARPERPAGALFRGDGGRVAGSGGGGYRRLSHVTAEEHCERAGRRAVPEARILGEPLGVTERAEHDVPDHEEVAVVVSV